MALLFRSRKKFGPLILNFTEHGFDDVILKPWQTAQLSELFQRVLVRDRDRKTSS